MSSLDKLTDDDTTVVPLRPTAPDTDTDDNPDDYLGDSTVTDPVTGDGGDDEPTRRPIVPAEWGRDTWRTTLADHAGLWWYKTRYHGVRSPKHTIVIAWYALRGVRRLTGRLMAWWQWTDGWILESQAVAAGRSGHHDAMNAHREGKKTRAARGQIVAACTVGAAVAGLVGWKFLPGWTWPLAMAGAAPVLARHGAPEGQPIIGAAVVPTAYQTPTPEIITRGLGSLGISAINTLIKNGEGLGFISDVHRDGDGWGVELDLPHGVTATNILQRREELASGLRRPLSATWPERVAHEHAGRLYLWIGRRDISKAKPIPYPLIRTGTTDVFATVPFAVTPRGQLVGAPLFEYNWVIGAAPGQGKTTGVRALASGIALDVLCDLWIHELAGKGDLEPLAQVSHRYTSGMDDDAIAYAAESVRKLKAEVHRRSEIFKKLPREAKPDGKLTRELAADRRRNLRPIGVIFDEVQNLILHPDHGGPALVEDLAMVERVGRAYGIIIIFATQRPDGDALPPKVRDLALVRFCLKVPDQVSNDMILGTGAYKAGYRASELRLDVDRGLGWFNGAGEMQAVRTHYLDMHDTARIAARARAMREAAGVLSGYALGEIESDEPARDFAADVLTVFGDARALWCETIAARLREHLPGLYADITQEAVSSQLRALGVTVKNVREPGKTPRKGCERAALLAITGAPAGATVDGRTDDRETAGEAAGA
ncbi:hypothetical protein [Spirillospora sp. CA-128828]|uniref:hypothetical protein n=1 Tax=Spirillospora sp. CA-128828 TaxID=3240033 RepID=UPI003D9199E5